MEPLSAALIIVLATLTVVALLLRLQGLQHLWINPDEGIYYLIASRSNILGLLQGTAAHAHPPLYYLILWLMHKLSSDLSFLRLLSVFSGVLSIPLLFLLVRSISGTFLGLLAAASLALAPGHIILSQTLRPYALFYFLLLLALIGFLRVIQEQDPTRGLRLFSRTMILLLFVHYAAFLVLLSSALSLFLILRLFPEQRLKQAAILRALGSCAIAVLAVIVINFQFALGHGMLRTLRVSKWLTPLYIDNIQSLPGNVSALCGFFWQNSQAGFIALFAFASIAVLLTVNPVLFLVILPPVVLSAMLSWLKLYPLGGSRHSIYLTTYLILAICACFKWPFTLLSAFQLKTLLQRPDSLFRALISLALLIAAAFANFSPRITHQAEWEQVVQKPELDAVLDRINLQRSAEVIYTDEQSFQLLVPLLSFKDGHMSLKGRKLNILPAYSYNSLSEIVADLPAPGAKPVLLFLFRWAGTVDIIIPLEEHLDRHGAGKLLFQMNSLSLFVLDSTAPVSL